MMMKTRKKLSFQVIVGLIVFMLSTISCSVLQNTGLFVDTKATNEAMQKTQDAQDTKATQQSLKKTADALSAQATQQAQLATQQAQSLESTRNAQQSTQQAQNTLQALQNNSNQNLSGSGQYNIYLVNNSSQQVCYFYVALSTSDSWGNDQLGGDTVEAGASYTLMNIPAGTYDLKVDDCSQNELATQFSFTVPDVDTWTLSDTDASGNSGGNYNLYIVNESSYTVCYLYVAPSSSSDWGPEQLGDSNTLAPGQTFTLQGLSSGNYDLNAQDCSNNVLAQYMDFNIPEYDTWTITN